MTYVSTRGGGNVGQSGRHGETDGHGRWEEEEEEEQGGEEENEEDDFDQE